MNEQLDWDNGPTHYYLHARLSEMRKSPDQSETKLTLVKHCHRQIHGI